METLRTLAIVGAAVGVGEAINASDAFAMPEAPAMVHTLTPAEQARYQHKNVVELGGRTIHLSMSADIVAHAAGVNLWTEYGGDPLFPQGAHNPVQFAQDVLSSLGQEALHDDGLSQAEIKAIDTATHEGKERLVHRPFGTEEEEMTFGVADVITEPNAKFEDTAYPGGFDAYSVTGEVITHKTLIEKIKGKLTTVKETLTDIVTIDLPTKCANVALFKRVHSISKKFIHKPSKKHTPTPTPVPVTPTPPIEICVGNTTNTNTGIASQGGNCSPNTTIVVTPPPPETSPPPPALQPPVIVGYNQPPGLEQPMQGTSYHVFFQADSPNGDSQQVTTAMSNPNCATASPAVRTSPTSDLYDVLVTASAADSCVGQDEQITGTVEDINTQLTDSVTEDLGGIIAQPSFGV
jgi:hypothetical protein